MRKRLEQFFAIARIRAFLRLSAGLMLLFSNKAGAQNQDDPKDLLLHARKNVLDTVERLPGHVCTQTVDRTLRAGQSRICKRRCPPTTILR
jgi:hypothetical protein